MFLLFCVDCVSEGISLPMFYGDLVYKIRRIKGEANFVSSGSKIVKRIRRRKHDPVIIEMTIGLLLGPSIALFRLFLNCCTLTNKVVGTIYQALSKHSQRRQGPYSRPLWLLVVIPTFIPWTCARLQLEHSLLWWVLLDIFDIFSLSPYMSVH